MERPYDLAEMLRAADGRTAYRKNTVNSGMTKPCIDTDYCVATPPDMNGAILTMAFVDMQPLESVYPTDAAFSSGTLFPNIDKPFYGGMKR